MKSKALTYILPRLRDVIFIIIFYLVILIGSMLFADGDPGRHITAGKTMIENRTILTKDIFSFTMAGQPVTPHEWLAQIAFAAADIVMGLNGVVLLTALVLAATFTILYTDLLRQKPTPLLAAGFALLAALATSLHWLARPHIFTLLFMALWAGRLKRVYEGEKIPVWQFAIIMLFWVNTHGAFIAGFVTWIAYIAGWFLQRWFSPEKPPQAVINRLLIIGGISFLVTFLNPVGWHLWQTSVGYVANRYLVDLTVEYASTDFHPPISWPALFFIGLVMFILSRGGEKNTWVESLLLAGWGMLGLYSVRNLPIFVLIAAPIIARHVQTAIIENLRFRRIEEQWHSLERSPGSILWPVLVVLIIGGLLSTGVSIDPQREGYHFRANVFPVLAVDWLEVHPQEGNMFNYFGWGGYLIYRRWPAERVFMDGQLDFYGETLTRQHQQVLEAAPGWENVLQEYSIQWLLVPVDEPISRLLMRDPEWETLYQDQTAVILHQQ